MARTTGPLASLSAAGTLIPGVTFRRRGGLTIIERTPYHAVKPTQASIANQTIIKCLTGWWHSKIDPLSFGWGAAVPSFGKTPYHAFLKYNLKRIWANLSPSDVFPASVFVHGGNATSFWHWESKNHVRFTVYSNSSAPRWCDVAWRTQTYPPVGGASSIAGIWLKTGLPYGTAIHDDFHVPAGVWYYKLSAVASNYTYYPGSSWLTFVVPG